MSKPKRAVLVMDDATGKRIRQLSLAEPYPKSQEIYLTIEFDDDSEILVEISCNLSFGINHLVRDGDGEMQPAKRPIQGTIRSLVKIKR